MAASDPHWIRWDGANSVITPTPPPDDAWGGYGYGRHDTFAAARDALLKHARAERDAWAEQVRYAAGLSARQVAMRECATASLCGRCERPILAGHNAKRWDDGTWAHALPTLCRPEKP